MFTTDDDQEGVLDGLMEALNTGSAFRDPARPARKKAGAKKGATRDIFTCVTQFVTRVSASTDSLNLLNIVLTFQLALWICVGHGLARIYQYKKYWKRKT